MGNHRTIARCVVGLTMAVATAGASLAQDRKPDTPQDAYDLRVGCAGIMAAAAVRMDVDSSASETDRAHAREMIGMTRDEAIQSGDAVGRSAAQTRATIDQQSQGILGRFASAKPDPAAVAKERQNLGRGVLDCALVKAIERSETGSAALKP